MKVIQVIPLLTVKNYINTWQRFSKYENIIPSRHSSVGWAEANMYLYLYLLTRYLRRGRVRIPHDWFFFHEGDIFKYHYCLNKTFYHFCYNLNVFTIVFFECFFVCFCELFFLVIFTFFTYSLHYNTIQNNTKEVSTNILLLLILCRNSLSTLLRCLCLRHWRSPE